MSALCLKSLIREYELASGQTVNFQKSIIYFSPNVEPATMENIKAVFGVEVVARHLKYLGLPSFISKNKKDIFAPIILRVSGVVARWKDKLISAAGKEVLIKLVAQAIPTYTMSLFRLPKGIVGDVQLLYKGF